MMVAIRATQSFSTYVGANCVTVAERAVAYVPKSKADELIAGGLAVLVEDAPPAPPETKVSTYEVPEADTAKTHAPPEQEPDAEARVAAEDTSGNATEQSPAGDDAPEAEQPAQQRRPRTRK